MQLFNLSFVLTTVLANNPNIYLLVLAALGWAVSLYFGFFRYRQYVWSRNKVRFDLMHKLDQRRSDIAAKLMMLCEISTSAKPRKARLRSLLRRYFSLLQQINFYQNEGVFDEAILRQFRKTINADLHIILRHDNELNTLMNEWFEAESTPGNFFSTLVI